MSEKIIIAEKYLPLLQAIENVPNYWAEHPLEDHEDLPQFNRKLVISGFNAPDQERAGDCLFISIRQRLVHKETGKVFRSIKAPDWEISGSTWSYFRDPADPSKLLEVTKQILDDETDEILSSEKTFLPISTIKYLKFLLLNKAAHLVDLFELYLKDFAEAKKTDLDKL